MSDPSTMMGGDNSRFGSTRWTMVLAAKEATETTYRENLEGLVRTYWKPVYSYVRKKWGKSNEDAKDLTQSFLADLLTRDFLAKVAPERGKFRTFLRACLQNFLRNQHDADMAQKRGGGKKPLSLDFVRTDGQKFVEPDAGPSPDQIFDMEWAQTVMREAIGQLRVTYDREDRPAYFRVFEFYLTGGQESSYDDIAEQTGLSKSDVSNYLVHARSRFREIVQGIVRDSVDSEEDVQQEMDALFGKL